MAGPGRQLGQSKSADAPAITRVVVPLDGTHEAEAAVTPALRVARPLRVPIQLLTVYNALHKGSTFYIDTVADRLDYENVEVECVGSGWPGDVIVDTVREQAGTLLCSATHNRDRLSRLVLGSVTEHVIRTLEPPIMLIGPQIQQSGYPAGFGRIVACLTMGDRDRTSLEIAHSWAVQLGLEIDLAHIVSPSTKNLGRIEEYMDKVANELAAGGVFATWVVRPADSAAQGLNALLTERPGAIVLLNSRRRVGLTRLVLGSVASELLETSPVPLLLTEHA